ncbi:hypothetical protein TrST_g6193 [Triparma strigata]|uniref:RRM domain-containing protein n=1 Tax=Triparma strigata TaxID=1606541 RepID=A0A9W7BDD5_9STRA|nr:hypothetical protein TrST_g6193 [Triparma strigata]
MTSKAPPLTAKIPASRRERENGADQSLASKSANREADVEQLEQAAKDLTIGEAATQNDNDPNSQESQRPGQTSVGGLTQPDGSVWNQPRQQLPNDPRPHHPSIPVLNPHNIVVPQSYDPFDLSAISAKLFVGGLDSKVTQADFYMYFIQFGEIIDSVVMFDKETNRSRGFGFVTYSKKEDAEKVMTYQEEKTNEARKAYAKGEDLDNVIGSVNDIRGGHMILNKLVEIKRAEPKKIDTAQPQPYRSKKIYTQHMGSWGQQNQKLRSRGRGNSGGNSGGKPNPTQNFSGRDGGNYVGLHANGYQQRPPQQAYAQQPQSPQQQQQQHHFQQMQRSQPPQAPAQPPQGAPMNPNVSVNYNPNLYNSTAYHNQYAPGNIGQFPMYYDPYGAAGAYPGATYPVYGENGEVYLVPYDPAAVVVPQVPLNGVEGAPQPNNGENGDVASDENNNLEENNEEGGEGSSAETEVNE